MSKVNIVMDNVYAKIIGADKETELAIYNELSFSVEEFGSDNVLVRHLFNRKTKKTYAGLVPNVIEILTKLGVEHEVIDTREKPEQNADFQLLKEIDIGGGKTVPLKSRPYQDQIISHATEREVIQAATGAGKTFMMAGLIEKYKVKPVLVFADKLSLVTQIKEEFEKFLGVEVGIIGGGIRDVKDITICSVQSMINEDELLEQAQFIMFDECLKYDSKVLMEDGTYEEIGKLVEEKSAKRVMSYNHKLNIIEPKSIVSHSKTPLGQNGKKLMRLTIKKNDGTTEIVECTDNHKIWVENLGVYVEAKDLVKGQIVKTVRKG